MLPDIPFGSRVFSAYQVCLMLVFGVGTYLMLRTNGSGRAAVRINFALIFPILLGALIGAKSLFIFFDGADQRMREALMFWRGGYYYHGGLLGGILGYLLYLACTRNNIIEGLDLAAPYAALGEAITRIGCFLSGCCWGAATESFPGVTFPRGSYAFLDHLKHGLIPSDALYSLSVHPVQLYTTLVMAGLFFALRYLYSQRAVRGEVVLHYLAWHGFLRFGLDYFRGDIERNLLGLSVTQWIAALTGGFAFTTLVLLYCVNANQPKPVLVGEDPWEAIPS